jgi:hypothetical protein
MLQERQTEIVGSTYNNKNIHQILFFLNTWLTHALYVSLEGGGVGSHHMYNVHKTHNTQYIIQTAEYRIQAKLMYLLFYMTHYSTLLHRRMLGSNLEKLGSNPGHWIEPSILGSNPRRWDRPRSR